MQSFKLQSSRIFYQAAVLFTAMCLLLTFNGCVFDEFDEPPVGGLPTLSGNTSIDQLKALHTLGSDPTPIPGGSLLEAVVAGNDVSGNIFRELYVQDATGGLVMRVEANGLNGPYPVGTSVVLNLDGLYIGDFNNKYQLTVIDGDRIPETLLPEVILRNNAPGEEIDVVPTPVTLDELNDPATFDRLLSTLIVIDGLQFVDSDAGAPFADVPGDQDLNRTLRDCFGNEIITRTSRFSDFAASLTPTGNGSVVTLLDVFGTTKQIKMREVADFNLTGERCGVSVGGELISIAELRSQFSGSTTSVSADTKIRGIVISDFTTNNLNGQNLFLQDGNAGIVVRFTDTHSFARGTELEISVSGLELSEFNGLLQVNNVPLDNAGSQGVGTLPTPQEVTISEINAAPETYESTLVQILDATISGAATLGNNLTVNDGTGNISMFTFNSATFANVAVPSGEVDVTAIVSDFNGVQLVIRDEEDVEAGGGTGGDPEAITAGELRTLAGTGTGFVPANRFIQGVVISDIDGMNTQELNLVIQTGESGIVLRFTDAPAFPLGQEIRVDIGGQELSEFNELLQVNNIPLANAMDVGVGTLPTPRLATIQEIIDNGEAWESTLVQIEDATISGGSVYDGLLTVTDNSGNLPMFTRGGATFANNTPPSDAVQLTAIVSDFGGRQVFIRNLSDVEE